MFTGIVQTKGRVTSAVVSNNVMRLVVEWPTASMLGGIALGASVAVNGTCLTVVAFDDNSTSFDVIDETLRLTNLATLERDHLVNLERAAKFGDEIGGHLLSGHIHCQAELLKREEQAGNLLLELSIPPSHQRYVLSKGYIAVDGISLTIGEHVTDGRFTLHLIPETRAITTINLKPVGAKFNIEIDSQTQAVVDTVERVLANQSPA
ncbi:riboflavin synthase subunit alpha [Neiella marina]|uniref:Riboflavin synthase n=1 Tax=Neiella holothuriorum TaxID=2870530 RepID=A0ABS7EGR7_9GAMM|nr:riboflavin synthase subunit alpha [Neiella holothuriorum]MBW8191541.1 riboflavin synthase subunit alpha [Neiella holothuriorum]